MFSTYKKVKKISWRWQDPLMGWLLAMACPVAYTTTKESYSKKAAFISQSKATPDPRKNKNRKATKSKLLKPTAITSPIYWIPQQTLAFPPWVINRFWSFIKSMKQDNVGSSPLKKKGIGEDVLDG